MQTTYSPDVYASVSSKNIKEIPKWSLAGWKVYAKCVKVYDGDSAQFAVMFPNNQGQFIPQRFHTRFLGYNSHEIRGGTEETKALAVKERNYLASRILDKIVYVEFGDSDKYGRPLVVVFNVNTSGGVQTPSVNKDMLDGGYGVVYMGGIDR